jgi:hypothetical protein
MTIRVSVIDIETGSELEDLGTCVCDSPGQAIQTYGDAAIRWQDKGYEAEAVYREVKNDKT